MPPVPLPTFSDITIIFNDDKVSLAAYRRLLPLEDLNPIPIRILGRMLVHAPWGQGRTHVAQRINSCTTDQQVVSLGNEHLMSFVSYCERLVFFPASADSGLQSKRYTLSQPHCHPTPLNLQLKQYDGGSPRIPMSSRLKTATKLEFRCVPVSHRPDAQAC
jgi:hypothetical protein